MHNGKRNWEYLGHKCNVRVGENQGTESYGRINTMKEAPRLHNDVVVGEGKHTNGSKEYVNGQTKVQVLTHYNGIKISESVEWRINWPQPIRNLFLQKLVQRMLESLVP